MDPVILKQILDAIYQGGTDTKDCAEMIRQIYRRLDDGFFENPPSPGQKLVLQMLLTLADEVEGFFK